MEAWILKWGSPKIYFFRISNLGQHRNPVLVWYKIWLFIHPNRKPSYVFTTYTMTAFVMTKNNLKCSNHTCLDIWAQKQNSTPFATQTSVWLGFLCHLFTFFSSLLVKEEVIFAFPSRKSAVTGWGRDPSAVRRGGQPSALEMHQKCWLCSWKTGAASWSRSMARSRKDALSKGGILIARNHPTTTLWQEVTAKLPLLSLTSILLTLWRFCRLQQSNWIIPANENVMFHRRLPQSLKSILI